jgi:bifunctional aspartokinase / homoserine dehydrogenase 1
VSEFHLILLLNLYPVQCAKDASELIQTDSNFGKAVVDFNVTKEKFRLNLHSFSGIAVVPGFIAKNAKGEFTTLGRGGSDYTAAIFAAALKVSHLRFGLM